MVPPLFEKFMRLVFRSRLLRFIYRTLIRPLSPRCPIRYSGIPSGCFRPLLDPLLSEHKGPWLLDNPEYEAGLLDGISRFVSRGDTIVVIGGGIGVTCVMASLKTGSSGKVICYEGSLEQLDLMKKTIRINSRSNIEVIHAVIGTNQGVYGRPESHGELVDPRDLPHCDVLEMDCEGAEASILDAMRIRPRLILVETHGHLGTPTDLIRSKLHVLGYSVVDLGVAEPYVRTFCEESDIRVLAALSNP
jgi:hypothetical protein